MFVVIAVLVLTGALPGLRTNEGRGAKLIMWGFDDPGAVSPLISKFTGARTDFEVKYFKKDIGVFESDLLNVIASGSADIPDVIVFPSGYLKKHAVHRSYRAVGCGGGLRVFGQQKRGIRDTFLRGCAGALLKRRPFYEKFYYLATENMG